MTTDIKNAIPTALNMVEILKHRAVATPKKTAYTFLADGENIVDLLTFSELDKRSQNVAVQLIAKCKPGDRVLLAYPPGLDFIPAFFGCLYAGVIAVPIQPPRGGQAQDKWMEILRDSNARAILTTSSFLNKPCKDGLSPFHIDENSIDCLTTDNLPIESGAQTEFPAIEGKNIAFLQYTSGSTSNPKGVIITHDNLICNAKILQEGFQLSAESKGFSWLPLYHDMGLIGGIIQPIYLGLHMILMSPLHFLQKPLRWLKAISRYQIEISGAPNFAFELCLRKIKSEQISAM